PRRARAPGSASTTATARPTGSASARAIALVATVPKMNGNAPKSSVTGFQLRVTRKPAPNLVTAGAACTASTAKIAINSTGATTTAHVVSTLKRSGAGRVRNGSRTASSNV